MRARLAVASWAALGVVLASCVSLKRTPEARFFVLRSLAEPAATPAPPLAKHGLVGVLPVRLPGHLERPQLVTWAAPGELRIDEFVRWGEPLDAGLTRTVTENLSLGGARVLSSHPFGVSDIIVVREVGGPFKTRAQVVGSFMGPNQVRRLNLKFLDATAPAHLVKN